MSFMNDAPDSADLAKGVLLAAMLPESIAHVNPLLRSANAREVATE